MAISWAKFLATRTGPDGGGAQASLEMLPPIPRVLGYWTLTPTLIPDSLGAPLKALPPTRTGLRGQAGPLPLRAE